MKYSPLLLLIFLLSCSSTDKGAGNSLKKSSTYNLSKARSSFKDFDDGPTKPSKVFVDVSKEVGLSSFSASKFYIYDLNDDGKEDIVLLDSNYSTPVILVRTKSGYARSKSIFFDSPVKASFLHFTDFDKDGIVDVLVAVHNQKTELTNYPLRVFKGTKNRSNLVFVEDTRYRNLSKKSPVSSVSVVDYDLDGQLDFFIANWYDLKSGRASGKLVTDRLLTFKNNRIYDVSGALLGENLSLDDTLKNATPTYGVSHCDIDGDGLVDFLTVNSSGHANKLWIAKFVNNKIVYQNYGQESHYAKDLDGDSISRGGGNSTYSLCRDYNNDGIMDIVLGEISLSYDPETRDRSSILTGEGLGFPPTFIRTEYTSDMGMINWNQGDRRGLWADFNNDGLSDLLVENSGFPPHSRLILFEQESNHGFVDLAKSYGLDIVNPAGITYLDYNGDGRLDILVSQNRVRNKNITPQVYLFENKLSKANSVSFKLEGSNSNRDGIGAMVKVTTLKGSVYSQWVQHNYGAFPSQNSSLLHFGLGEDSLREVEVSWPFLKDGKRVSKIYKEPFIRKGPYILLKE